MNKILLIISLIGLIAFSLQIKQGSSTNNAIFDIEILGAFKAGGYLAILFLQMQM